MGTNPPSQTIPPTFVHMPPVALSGNLFADLEAALRAHGISDVGAYLDRFKVCRGIRMYAGEDGILSKNGFPACQPEQIGNEVWRTIELSETFISWVWICAYYFNVNRQHMLVVHGRSTSDPALSKALQSANDLMSYGESLFHTRNEWPTALPSPENVIVELQEFTEQSNALYVAAMQFIVLHELGHGVYGHSGTKGTLSIQQEQDADDYAIDIWGSFAAQSPSDNHLHTLQQGACIAFLALVYIPEATKPSSTHPPLDQRLDKLLHAFQLEDNSIVWYMAAQCLQHWTKKQFDKTLEDAPSMVSARDYYNAIRVHLTYLLA